MMRRQVAISLLVILLPALATAQRSRGGRRGSEESASTHPITLIGPSSEISTSSRSTVHVAARVASGIASQAEINGTTVPVYGTGLFVRDGLPLQMGANTVTIKVQPTGGTLLERTLQITRVVEEAKPTSASLPLVIDTKTIIPAENVALLPGEDLEVSFTASPGNASEFMLAGGTWTPMGEVVDSATTTPSGVYRGTIRVGAPAPGTDTSTSHPILLRMRAGTGSSDTTTSLLVETKARVQVLPENAPPQLVRVKADDIGHLAYGLTDVRLGGPYLAELTSGTVLRVVGRRGFNLKVQLSPDQYAWIPAYEVEPAPPGTAIPHLEFTDMNTTITADGNEALIIPYASPVPFAVRDVVASEQDGSPSIAVDFYGAHNACTWITHRRPGKVIRQVTIDQIASDHLRVTAQLHGKRLWGYKWDVTTSSLLVTVRKPPVLKAGAASPLAGLTIAVEAGHGGSNSGARGITGAQEKDVTRAVANVVERQLTEAGAKVIQTRIGDESVGLSTRAQRAMEANADLFVSIHCNSAGSTRGFLSVAGNAMFYKHPFNHDLAAAMHQQILQQTGLVPFGTVGNFNYAPVRILTWMPAVLVEQAFISNPLEESLMIDPAFQQKMAAGIRLGLEDWLNAD